MAYDTTSAADAAALIARRERVRALAGQVAQAVEALDVPRTFFDAERAVRAITVADRMLVRLPDPQDESEGISPARQRLRLFADRILAVIEGLSSPASFRDAERAARCVLATDTLLTQLYAPPKAARRPKDAFDAALTDEPEDSPEIATGRLFDKLDRVALAFSREVGFYPDGTACDPAQPEEPQHLGCPEEVEIIDQWISSNNGKPFLSDDGLLPLAQILTARANGSVRAQARHIGHWPDGRKFDEKDGPFFALSKRFAAEVLKQPGADDGDVDEAPAHELFPWWLVRNPDTG
jgi:hypothetical protein